VAYFLGHPVYASDMPPNFTGLHIQGGPKNKPLPIDKKIVLKPVNEIIFIRQIKVWIKHNNIIRCH